MNAGSSTMSHPKTEDIIVKIPLEVRLTDQELKTASKALAEAINKKSRIEGDLETFKMQKKAEVQSAEAEVSRNAILVQAEKEFRLVECKVSYNFGAGVKSFIRLDNGEVARREPISNEERQRMLPGLTPKAANGKAEAK